MAKKTATKKKKAGVKAKSTKVKKPVVKPSKPAKFAKSAVKAVKAVAKILKSSPKKVEKSVPEKKVKPALMTKNGRKNSSSEEIFEKPAAKKTQTIVAMMESDSVPEALTKAEKTGKAKPVKIVRGNLADEKAKWAELAKKYGKERAVTYKMTESYPALVPLQHKVLGWGYILTNENDRLEVLFENGIRMLISNYKT